MKTIKIFAIIVLLISCTIGRTPISVTVNQYGDSDSAGRNITNIQILKDTVKTTKTK